VESPGVFDALLKKKDFFSWPGDKNPQGREKGEKFEKEPAG
jgi:hypothetical protein